MKKSLMIMLMAGAFANVGYADDHSQFYHPFDTQGFISEMNAHFERMDAQFEQMEKDFDNHFKNLKKNTEQPSYYSQQSFSHSSFNSISNSDSPLSIAETMAFQQVSSKDVRVNKDSSKRIYKEFAGNLLGTNYPWLNKMLVAMEYHTLDGKKENPSVADLNQIWQQKYQAATAIDETMVLKVKQKFMGSYADIASFYQESYQLDGEDKQSAEANFATLNVNLKTKQIITLEDLVQADKFTQFKAIVINKFKQWLEQKETTYQKGSLTTEQQENIAKIQIPLKNNYYVDQQGIHFVFNHKIKNNISIMTFAEPGVSEINIPWSEVNGLIKKQYLFSAN